MTATMSTTVMGVVVIDLSTPLQGTDDDRRAVHRALAGAAPGTAVRLLVGSRRMVDLSAVHGLRHELPPLRIQIEGCDVNAVDAWVAAIRNDPPPNWWEADGQSSDPWCA